MYNEILYLHSITRYIVLLFLLLTIIKSFDGWFRKREFSSTDNRIGLLTLVIIHLQLLVGLLLYFISPIVQKGMEDFGNAMKIPELRYWTVEHIGIMIVAVILITLGRVLSKRAETDTGKHKKMALFLTIGLVLILIAIPWPFSEIQRPWF